MSDLATLLELYDKTIGTSVSSVTCAHDRDREREKTYENENVRSHAQVTMSTLRSEKEIVDLFVAAGFADKCRQRIIRLGCNYKGVFRTVNSQVCRWHIKEKDEYCLKRCENLWVRKRLLRREK